MNTVVYAYNVGDTWLSFINKLNKFYLITWHHNTEHELANVLNIWFNLNQLVISLLVFVMIIYEVPYWYAVFNQLAMMTCDECRVDSTRVLYTKLSHSKKVTADKLEVLNKSKAAKSVFPHFQT